MKCSVTLNLRTIIRYPNADSIVNLEKDNKHIVTSFMNALVLKLNSKAIENEKYIFWAAERVEPDKCILSFESNATYLNVDDIRRLLTDGKELAIEEACKLTGLAYLDDFDKSEMIISQFV